MFSKKMLNIFNVSLILVIILLTMNLFSIQLPNLGQALYALDNSPHLCAVDNNGIVLHPDLNRCCFEARNLAKCTQDRFEEFTVKCQNSPNQPSIRMNNKAYGYCLDSEIWP